MTINFGDGTTIASGGSLGKVLQTISVVKQDTFSEGINANTNSSSCGLDVTITPSSSSSKVLIMVQATIGTDTDEHVGFVLERGGSTLSAYLPTGSGSRTTFGSGTSTRANSYPVGVSGTFLDSPSTTSATTYSARLKYGRSVNDLDIYLNRAEVDTDAIHKQRSVSTITAMEIAA